MSVLGFLWKTFKRLVLASIILTILIIAFVGYSAYRVLPTYNAVPADDPIWTSAEYIQHFQSPSNYKLVESFYLEEYVYFKQMMPELADNETAFAERAKALYWNIMTEPEDGATKDYDGLRTPIINATTTDQGTVRLFVTAEGVSNLTLIEDVYTRNIPYRAGIEVFSVKWWPGAGAILRITYLFHHALPPAWEKMEWWTLYMQLCGRTQRLSRIAGNLRRKQAAKMMEMSTLRREQPKKVHTTSSESSVEEDVLEVGHGMYASREEIVSVRAGELHDEL